MSTTNLPTASPAEAVQISPEHLEIANTYLQSQNINDVALALDISPDLVASTLSRREVQSYIDAVFLDTGYNNRFKIRRALDAVIATKFREMEESQMGSTKDIAELLALSHKMTMDELSRQIELQKLKNSQIKTQTNVQINDMGGGTNYGKLLSALINTEVIDE